MQPSGQFLQVGEKTQIVLGGQIQLAGEFLRDRGSALFQHMALVGERDINDALIGGSPLSENKSSSLQAFEKRREGSRIEVEQHPDLLDRALAPFPQDEQDEILGIGNAEFLE